MHRLLFGYLELYQSYLPGGGLYVSNSTGSDMMYYILTDYQGNWNKVIAENGSTVEEYSFDPWGRRRNPSDWSYANLQTSYLFDRGYTGHEHLDQFGLINMNGRVYDPFIARFLSPDNFVQNPFSSISLNRYNYGFNNPLLNSDPNGEIIFTILSAIFCPALLPMAIQTDIGWISGGIKSKQNGGKFWQGAIEGGIIGSINGALSMMSPLKLPLGESNFGLKIAPQLSVGTDGMGVGVNTTLGYDLGKGYNVGVNFGGTYYSSAIGTGEGGFEGRIGYGIGYEGKVNIPFLKPINFQGGIGSTYFFSGNTSQLSGQVFAGGENWKLTYENDTWASVPGLFTPGGADRDKYRTAAIRFDITGGNLEGTKAGLNLFTGESDGFVYSNGVFRETSEQYRLGVLYLGYRNYRIGYNSEINIRGPIQNGFHDLFDYPYFEVLDISDRAYFGYYSSNPFTLW